MKKRIAALLLFVIFIAFIGALKVYDVAPIGPEGTEVGFSHINQKVHELTGVNLLWYEITDYIGYGALALCGVFALAGLVQLIKRKSLFKVDREMISLGALFAADIFFYVLFEKVVINCRPVIMPDETAPEASFPSSHTMLSMCVFLAAAIIAGRYIKSSGLAGLVKAACIAVTVITVGGRLYSGAHWFTDITGGIILSAALLLAFADSVSRSSRDANIGSEKKPLSESDKVIDGYRCKH